MSVEHELGRTAPERSELELVRSDHGNVTQLLLALESHLALMIMGERFDGRLMIDALDYLLDYVSELHSVQQERLLSDGALQTSGAELYHRLDLAMRDESIDRGEVVRLGYAYCTALRRSMLLDEATFSDASVSGDRPALDRPAGDEDRGYRARYEELTRRIGCDCAFGER